MHYVLEAAAWLIAVLWVTRVFAAWRGLPTVPDLLRPEFDRSPAGEPAITVIVPARNEAANVRGCIESLVAQDYAGLRVVAVDDRSTDATGALLDELAEQHAGKLEVLHVTELPAEWLGKTHAMAFAARTCQEQRQVRPHAGRAPRGLRQDLRGVLDGFAVDYLLFTDADVIFAPGAIRRALAYAVDSEADHLVLLPTTIIRRWDEAALLSLFTLFGLWGARPWKIADPRAKRDALGVGAFNLVRRSAYEQVGGYEALRMEIVEDIGMGRRIKRAGLRSRVAFGKGLVSIHWAAGVPGLVGVLTKNIFAAVNFHVPLLLNGCLLLAAFYILPFVLVWDRAFTAPAVVALAAIACGYGLTSRFSGLSTWNALLAPFAAAVFCFTLLRSMAITLRQGGVVWRGTFYSLPELKRHRSPLF